MPDAVIVDAIRTPIGRAMRGSLKTVRADELRAQVTRTVRHELAHHLGADELGVRDLGL